MVLNICVKFISLQKNKPLQAKVGKYVQDYSSFCLSLQQIFHCEKELQCDADDDSGMGFSISTDTKSATFSAVSHYIS